MRANWGPKYARLRAGEDSACTRLTISCAGIVNDCRSVLPVPKTVQSKLNRDEILHIFIAHGEQHAIPSQLIVIFVHGLKRLHPSPIIQVDVGAVSLRLVSAIGDTKMPRRKGTFLGKNNRGEAVCDFASKTLQWRRSCLRRGVMRGRLSVRVPLIATALQSSGDRASACARNEQASHANRECRIASLC